MAVECKKEKLTTTWEAEKNLEVHIYIQYKSDINDEVADKAENGKSRWRKMMLKVTGVRLFLASKRGLDKYQNDYFYQKFNLY